MLFITNQEDCCSSYRGRIIYKPVEIEESSHQKVIDKFITDHVRPHDLDGEHNESFHVRFSDDVCYLVEYSAWAEFEPEWYIHDTTYVTEIPLEDCEIKERPCEFISKSINVTNPAGVCLRPEEEVIGVYMSSPPRIKGEFSFANRSGCLPLITTDAGDLALKIYVMSVNSDMVIPFSVILDNGYTLDIQVKAPNPEFKRDDTAFEI